MSRSTNRTLTCPCGEVFTSEIYEYVNVAKDPQLQYTVLAGLLNVSTCPSCGRRAAIARPFIYSDPAITCSPTFTRAMMCLKRSAADPG